jgi:hypothetical protein
MIIHTIIIFQTFIIIIIIIIITKTSASRQKVPFLFFSYQDVVFQPTLFTHLACIWILGVEWE